MSDNLSTNKANFGTLPVFLTAISTILGAIAKDHKMSITAGYIVPENASQEQKEAGEKRIDETLQHIDKQIKYQKEIIESKSIAGGIASASRKYDLVVIGAAKEPFFRKMLFGEIPEKVARFSPTSVLVVKKYEWKGRMVK